MRCACASFSFVAACVASGSGGAQGWRAAAGGRAGGQAPCCRACSPAAGPAWSLPRPAKAAPSAEPEKRGRPPACERGAPPRSPPTASSCSLVAWRCRKRVCGLCASRAPRKGQTAGPSPPGPSSVALGCTFAHKRRSTREVCGPISRMLLRWGQRAQVTPVMARRRAWTMQSPVCRACRRCLWPAAVRLLLRARAGCGCGQPLWPPPPPEAASTGRCRGSEQPAACKEGGWGRGPSVWLLMRCRRTRQPGTRREGLLTAAATIRQ